jgi:hypothetical protein
MTRSQFDWDKYLATAVYRDVCANSPELSSRRPPSLYNPDRTLLYLPSLDLDVATDDYNELRQMLRAVVETFRFAQRKNEIRKMAIAQIDCTELCGLLQTCAPDPEPYVDPDALLHESSSL